MNYECQDRFTWTNILVSWKLQDITLGGWGHEHQEKPPQQFRTIESYFITTHAINILFSSFPYYRR